MHPATLPESAVCRLAAVGRVWLCDDDLGVSRAPVHALAQDPKGYLWIGTEDGPMLFDGLVWRTPVGLAALRGAFVRAAVCSPDGIMWLATDGAGLASVDITSTPYQPRARLNAADGLPSDRVHALAVDPSGQVWAGTHAGLALIRDGRVVRVYTTDHGLPANTVWSVAIDPSGQVWVGTRAGLAILVDGEAIGVPSFERLAAGIGVHHLYCDPSGALWLALIGGQLIRGVDTGAGLEFAAVYNCGTRVRSLCADTQERLWVGLSGGVLLLEQGVVRDRWTMADGLPSREVWALAADRDGRIWAGTSTGVVVLDDPTAALHTLPHASGHQESPVYAVATDRADRVWIGGESGLSVVMRDGRAVAVRDLPRPLRRGTVWSLLLDTRGRIWAGTDRHGLYCLDPQTGKALARFRTTRHVPVMALQGASLLWAAMTGLGLVCFDTERIAPVAEIGIAAGLQDDNVQGLAVDAAGMVWAGTWSGWLARVDASGRAIDATVRLSSERQMPVTDMQCDRSGALWVSTYGGGLVSVDPAALAVRMVYTSRDGLPTDLLYACRISATGDIWVGTRHGVARYTPPTGRCMVVSRSLGLPSDECNSHALHLEQRGTLWVGTVQGVGIIETHKIPADVPPCEVHLTQFTVMGSDRALMPEMEIEDTEYDLGFQFGAIAFDAAPQVVYRVQLMGLEDDWSPPSPQRSARYTNLRPGNYVFRVAARNWGGQWGAPLELRFRVIRDRRAQEIEERLERERIEKDVAQATAGRLEELNRELRETDRLKTALIRQIRDQSSMFERLSLQDGLTGLLNRRALDAQLAETFHVARRDGRLLTVALADIDHFKEINDTFSHLVGDEVLKTVAHLCQSSARRGDSVGRYGGEEIALLLPDTPPALGVDMCERLRLSVERHPWESISPGLRVTISVGLSGWLEAPAHELMMAHADRCLYQAKAFGRNRIVSAASPQEVDAPSLQQSEFITDVQAVELLEATRRTDASAAGAALVDNLTGLGNRRAFESELEWAVVRARQAGELLSVARVSTGDAVPTGSADDALVARVSSVLRRARTGDRAFRLGGSEFAVILPRTSVVEAAIALARMRQTAAREIDGTQVGVGVAALRGDEHDAGALLQQADAALRVALQQGRRTVVTFEEAREFEATGSQAPARALYNLLLDGAIEIAFQPIFALDSARLLGVEALARPPQASGLDGPKHAFEIAEQLGRAHELDLVCRRATLRRAANLPRGCLLFVNMALQTFEQDLLAGRALLDEVEAAGLTAERIVLEISERSLAQSSLVVREGQRLRSMGFRLALDHAGAGGASLELLSEVPFDFYKIDRMVTARAPQHPPARAIFAGIISLARERGARVVVTGVESEEMMTSAVRAANGVTGDAGVIGVQGYFLGRPDVTLDLPRRGFAADDRAWVRDVPG